MASPTVATTSQYSAVALKGEWRLRTLDPHYALAMLDHRSRVAEENRKFFSHSQAPMSGEEVKEALAGIKRSVETLASAVRGDVNNLDMIGARMETFEDKLEGILKTLEAIRWESITGREQKRLERMRVRALTAKRERRKVRIDVWHAPLVPKICLPNSEARPHWRCRWGSSIARRRVTAAGSCGPG